MTWAEAAKALNEAQDKKNGLAGLAIDGDPQEAGGSGLLEPITALGLEESPCGTYRHDGECVGKKAYRNGCMGYEGKGREPELGIGEGAEGYGWLDVDLLLGKYRQDLKSYHEAGCPPNMIKTQRMLVDALALLLGHISQA